MRVRNKEIRNARKRLEERIKLKIREAKAAAGTSKGKGRRKATGAE